MKGLQIHRLRECASARARTHRVSRTQAATVSLAVGPCQETARTRKVLWSPTTAALVLVTVTEIRVDLAGARRPVR
jgi:hypothetical protein